MSTGPPNFEKLIIVLQEARALLARPNNDFAWSSWNDASAALRELDGHITRLQAGELPSRADLDVLFLPTGPIQEVSVSSGWGGQFLALANRFDAAMRRLYGPHPRDKAAIKAQWDGYVQQMFTDGMRWFSTGIAVLAIAYSIYLQITHDTVEAYFPLHLRGTSLKVAIGLSAFVFGSIAALNWIKCFKKRRIR